MKNIKPAFRNAYRLYVLLCVIGGAFMQQGNAHPDYLLGAGTGLIGSWIVPGILLEFLLHQSNNITTIFGGSAVFWIIAWNVGKASGKPSATRPRSGNGGGIVVANPSDYVVLPDLPPKFGYYTRPETRTTRTTVYMDEEG